MKKLKLTLSMQFAIENYLKNKDEISGRVLCRSLKLARGNIIMEVDIIKGEIINGMPRIVKDYTLYIPIKRRKLLRLSRKWKRILMANRERLRNSLLGGDFDGDWNCDGDNFSLV